MLHIHRAERADGLVEALRELLADAPADPFAAEVVAVPTRGMERWLTQRLSAVLGRRRRGRTASARTSTSRRRAGSWATRWRPPRGSSRTPTRGGRSARCGRCWRSSTRALGEPWLRAARRAPRRRRTTSRARAALRQPSATSPSCSTATRSTGPSMVRAWAAGDDARRACATRWQAELWRRLRERIGAPEPGRAARRGVRAAAGASRSSSTCPSALSLFGLTRLPAGAPGGAARARRAPRRAPVPAAPVARAVGAGRRGGAAPRSSAAPTTRRADCPRNRLLASWGQDARELQLVLGRRDATRRPPPPGRARAATRCSRGSRPTCATTARRRRAAAGDRTRAARPGDRSVQVHACHGRARQVEVLRDAILHLLADDPTLEPRDVIVMCPDIETFAPLIQATFGAGEVAGRGRADALPRGRAARPARPARRPLAAPDQPGARRRRASCSSSPAQRLTASQVLDLADREPVRRRFRLDDDDLARLRGLGRRRAASAGASTPRTARRSSSTTLAGGHLARRARPAAARRDDDRGRAAAVRRRAAARRRRERRDRPRRPVRRAGRPAAGGASTRSPRRSRSPRGRRRSPTAADALTATAPRDAWQRAELQRAARRRRRARPAAGATRALALRRGARAARRAAAGPPDARELPHRPPDDLHARADALGAAPRRLPARPRRRRVPAQGAARRRRPDARRPARRRPRPAHRGPPAAARRAAGRRPTG